MKQPPVKPNWIDTCVSIYNFHVSQKKDEFDWTIEKTAKVLNRSEGAVSQYLMLASWLKTHERQLKKFRCAKDALEFVRNKKREINSQELEL